MSQTSPSDDRPQSDDETAAQPPGSAAPSATRRIGGVPVEAATEGATTESAGDERAPAAGATPMRGVGLALLAATTGALIMVVLGGPLAFTYGLIVVAYFIGRFAALGLRAGAGPTISATNRVTIAILVSLLAVTLGFMGIWVVASGEGGRLSLFDYLASVYGALVPIQFIVATLAAWWGAR